MKNRNFTNNICLIALLLLCVALRAQTIAGSAFPAAGTNFSLIECDTAVAPGPGGSGMTWNFTSLAATTGFQVDSFIAPSATPYGSLFPSATIALHEIAPPSTNNYIYFENDAANGVYKRLANVQLDTVVYTDPSNEYPYPLAYGNSYSDTYYGSYPYHGSYAAEAGTLSGSVDGAGILTLPTGTYSNVLRSHYTRNEKDTITANGALFPLVSVFDYYVWYQPDVYFPILSIATSSVTSALFNKSSKSVAYRAGYSTAGINTPSAGPGNGLMAFPNPAASRLTITYNKNEVGESVISIYDLTGRMVQSATHSDTNIGMQLVQLNMSALPVGLYELQVVNAENTTSTKLQITK